MRRSPVLARCILVLGATVAFARGAAGDPDLPSMDDRYAAFQDQWAHRTHAYAHMNVSGNGHFRMTKPGHLDPVRQPAFTEDFEARQVRLDEQIDITGAHAVATGNDVVVAVLDGGFNLNHPWISDRILPYGFDPVGNDWNPQDLGNGVDDDSDGCTDAGVGHGTFVSGQILEVAPDAWIIPVRIADDEGYGSEADLLEGLTYAIDMEVDVINLSYETCELTSAVRGKLEEAYAQGITVVVSVGNGGGTSSSALAGVGSTIAVGAVNDYDVIASFSNTPSDGEGITLFAPGVDLGGPYGGATNDVCCTWSGTSFSAALVSGAVALALEVDPTLSPDQVRQRMVDASTTTVHTAAGATYSYAGRIDLLDVVDP